MIGKVVKLRSGIAYLSTGHAVGADTRIKNAPHGHGCLVREGDELEFEPLDTFLKAARFVHIPDCELQHEELSEVTAITDDGLIFGKRIDCQCGIFMGIKPRHPNLKIGTVVSHTVEMDHFGRPIAENIKVVQNPQIAAKEK